MGIAHEGWEVVGQDRYRLKEKMTYAGIMDGEKFWDTLSLRLAKRYDLAQIGQIIVGGGGGVWGCIPVGSISPSEGIAPRVE